MQDRTKEGGAALFPLRPIPERAGSCPRCHEELEVLGLRFPGWRSLLEGACPACGNRYLQDLPAGHGLIYPSTLDLDTGEVFDPAGAFWFSSWLRPAWEQPDGRPVVFDVDVKERRSSVVLLNCLDVVYGHSLLKLLNVQQELVRDSHAGCILLVPGSLVDIVPAGVAEIWAVCEPISRFRGWLCELEERLGSELDRFDRCVLSPAYPHPHPATYDLGKLLGDVPPKRCGEPSILLSLRDDRLWGESARKQCRNLAELRERIGAAFPDAGWAAIGVGGATPLPADIADLRAANPDETDERSWLELMRGADLVIGVHGSNMLLPSGLARATIELLPEERYGNVLQDTLVSQHDPLTALTSHRTLYGDTSLSDIHAERVAAVAVSVLLEGDRFRRLMTGPAAGEAAADIPLIAASPVRDHPHKEPGMLERLRMIRPHRGAHRLARGLWVHATRRPRPVRTAPTLVEDRNGLRFELESAEEIEQFARHGGHFEQAEIEMAVRYLEPGMTVFDVGANIGAFTAPFAKRVGTEGSVHAFEPLAEARRRLERTIQLNGLSNVTINALALSNEVGGDELFAYGPGFESWAGLAPREIEYEGRTLVPTERTHVETTTLDAYCEAVGIGQVDLLKIDVEGAEERVLRGARQLLEREAIAAALVEVSDNTLGAFGSRAFQVLELLETYGLRPHVIRGGRVQPFRIAGAYHSLANVLALSRAARARLSDVIE